MIISDPCADFHAFRQRRESTERNSNRIPNITLIVELKEKPKKKNELSVVIFPYLWNVRTILNDGVKGFAHHRRGRFERLRGRDVIVRRKPVKEIGKIISNNPPRPPRCAVARTVLPFPRVDHIIVLQEVPTYTAVLRIPRATGLWKRIVLDIVLLAKSSSRPDNI